MRVPFCLNCAGNFLRQNVMYSNSNYSRWKITFLKFDVCARKRPRAHFVFTAFLCIFSKPTSAAHVHHTWSHLFCNFVLKFHCLLAFAFFLFVSACVLVRVCRRIWSCKLSKSLYRRRWKAHRTLADPHVNRCVLFQHASIVSRHLRLLAKHQRKQYNERASTKRGWFCFVARGVATWLFSGVFLQLDAMLARCCPHASVCPSVRQSVCHKPVLHRNDWTNRAGFWYGGFPSTVSYGKWESPNNRVLPLGLCPKLWT